MKTEPQPQDEHATEALPTSAVEAFAQALKDAQAAGGPVADIAAAMADGEAIKAEIIEGGSEGRLLIITTEPKTTQATEVILEAGETSVEAKLRPEDNKSAKKSAHKGKVKKSAAATEDANR